jgi:hypothetical protein
MKSRPAGELPDLLAAGEAVGDHARLIRSGADFGQQAALGAPPGDFEMLAALEAEGAGHAAAAGVEDLDLEARSGEQGLLVGRPEQRALMAVRLRYRAAREASRDEAGRLAPEESREEVGLPRQPPGIGVVGKELRELVAENRGARRLEHDDRDPLPEGLAEGIQDAA